MTRSGLALSSYPTKKRPKTSKVDEPECSHKKPKISEDSCEERSDVEKEISESGHITHAASSVVVKKKVFVSKDLSKTPKFINDYSNVKFQNRYINDACIYCNEKSDACETARLNCESGEDRILTNEEELIRFCTSETNCFFMFHFNIYDPNGHLCSLAKFDSDGAVLLLSGTITLNGLTLVDHIGPIIEWNVISKNIVEVSTKHIRFFLSYPDKQYERYFEESVQKYIVKKYFLSYLEKLKVSVSFERMKKEVIRISKDTITIAQINKHLKFICLEISKWLDNLDYSRKFVLERYECIQLIRSVLNELTTQSKTFTPLVENILTLIEFNKSRSNSKHLCGVCKGCAKPDCGKCRSCKVRYTYKAYVCDNIKCKNMKTPSFKYLNYDKNTALQGYKPAKVIQEKVYYNEIKIGSTSVKQNDFVMKKSSFDMTFIVVRIMYMWYSKTDKELYFHGQIFIQGPNTVLGPFSDKREIFMTNDCSDKIPVSCILHKIDVEKTNPKDFCFESSIENNTFLKKTTSDYFYNKFYNVQEGSFLDLPVDPPGEDGVFKYCPTCARQKPYIMSMIPKVEYFDRDSEDQQDIVSVVWKNHKYVIGNGVYLEPEMLDLYMENEEPVISTDDKDEDIYKEKYRKPENGSAAYTNKNPLPYCIGIIDSIYSTKNKYVNPENIKFVVNMFFRPENTCLENYHNEDLNSLYWVNIKKTVILTEIIGPVDLIYKDNIRDKTKSSKWIDSDLNLFCINGAYNTITHSFYEAPAKVKKIGMEKVFLANSEAENPKKLRTLEVFSGSGGFASGILESNVVDIKWAIEFDTEIARSYQINYPECNVIKEEANVFLSKVIKDRNDGSNMPKKKELDFILCSPPCQGFSLLNRFKDSEYSSLQNSLIFTSLSYFDYFRPKYFLLENVRNLATFENGSVTQSILRFLLDCGYQCSFMVLQAGNFGVPQNRRRFFIWAAAPGFKLPKFPEPTHCFNHPTSLNIVLNDIQTGPTKQFYSAPRRSCTIRDAISDLPLLYNNDLNLHANYKCQPESEYQRNMRSTNHFCISDHISKPLNLLNKARVVRIPKKPGSDWRDLPNIPLVLPNGKAVSALKYDYFDETGSRHGVCSCINNEKCTAAATKTSLIPWFLAHTADKNNNWEGVLGRLDWKSFFKTTLTNPNPLGKQGRVFHPSQDRIVSIRECARSQGFPDSFTFTGCMESKYKQVGNAVPPPLARSIGKELRVALNESNW